MFVLSSRSRMTSSAAARCAVLSQKELKPQRKDFAPLTVGEQRVRCKQLFDRLEQVNSRFDTDEQ
jgi:hypothetical protein